MSESLCVSMSACMHACMRVCACVLDMMQGLIVMLQATAGAGHAMCFLCCSACNMHLCRSIQRSLKSAAAAPICIICMFVKFQGPGGVCKALDMRG